jgi:hypothetical protein
MKIAGVTVSAVARPTPRPAQAPVVQPRCSRSTGVRPRGGEDAGRPGHHAARLVAHARRRRATMSAVIRPNASRLRVPRPSVARTGSMVRARAPAASTAGHRRRPYRRATGPTSATRDSPSAATPASAVSQPATGNGRNTAGATRNNAGGGSAVPRRVSGSRYAYRPSPDRANLMAARSTARVLKPYRCAIVVIAARMPTQASRTTMHLVVAGRAAVRIAGMARPPRSSTPASPRRPFRRAALVLRRLNAGRAR